MGSPAKFLQRNPLVFKSGQHNSKGIWVGFRFWLDGKDLEQKLDTATLNLRRAATQSHKHRTTGDHPNF